MHAKGGSIEQVLACRVEVVVWAGPLEHLARVVGVDMAAAGVVVVWLLVNTGRIFFLVAVAAADTAATVIV